MNQFKEIGYQTNYDACKKKYEDALAKRNIRKAGMYHYDWQSRRDVE